MTKTIVIIGSVAAGTSVAAKARRNNEDVNIVVFDKDTDISYSVCGIPYVIGGEVESIEQLTPRDARWFKDRFNINIFTSHEVNSIDHHNKKIQVTNLLNDDIFSQDYDELIIATGSTPKSIPQIKENYKNVFKVKTINDAKAIQSYLEIHSINNIAIIGGGFIGLEMLEQLSKYNVSLIQRSTLMSHMDEDMSYMIKSYLEDNVHLYTHVNIEQVNSDDGMISSIQLSSNDCINTDLVIVSTGVTPNTKLTDEIGIENGVSGAIKVNEKLETNIPHIYAVGDVAETFHVHTKLPMYRPLGSTANKMGRIAGDRLTGGDLIFNGILGTGIVRIFDLTVAYTGITEKEAEHQGIKTHIIHNIKPNKPDYMGGREMTIKAVIDVSTNKIIGAQIVGFEGVDKRIDVIATAITFGAKADDLFHLDLAYTPAFSTTKDPILYTGMIANNITKGRKIITPGKLIQKIHANDILVLDVRDSKQYEKNHVETAINVPLSMLRDYAKQLDKSQTIVTYCNKGTTGNAAQNVLINLGFKDVYNLSGGNTNYQRYVNMLREK